MHIHKDNPWHVRSFVKFCDQIGSHDASKQLEERAVYLQHGEEEHQGDADAEEMTQSRLARGYANKETCEWVCNQQT